MSEARQMNLQQELDNEDQNEALDLGSGVTVTLADIMDLPVNEEDEVRFRVWPAGTYRWELTGYKTSMVNTKNGRDGKIELILTCREIKQMNNPKGEYKEEDWINQEFHQNFFVKTDGQGRCLAFLKDMGYNTGGPKIGLREHLDKATGTQCIIKIVQTKDGNKTYSNLSNQKTDFKPV